MTGFFEKFTTKADEIAAGRVAQDAARQESQRPQRPNWAKDLPKDSPAVSLAAAYADAETDSFGEPISGRRDTFTLVKPDSRLNDAQMAGVAVSLALHEQRTGGTQ